LYYKINIGDLIDNITIPYIYSLKNIEIEFKGFYNNKYKKKIDYFIKDYKTQLIMNPFPTIATIGYFTLILTIGNKRDIRDKLECSFTKIYLSNIKSIFIYISESILYNYFNDNKIEIDSTNIHSIQNIIEINKKENKKYLK